MAVETQQGTIFVGGEFRPPSGGATAPVLDKARGEPLAVVGVASVEDVDAAVAAAVAAQPEWAAARYEERPGCCAGPPPCWPSGPTRSPT